MNESAPLQISRRDVLKGLTAAGVVATLPSMVRAATAPSLKAVSDYLATLRKSDNGYSWPDWEISHLTPTFHVIGAYRVLKQTPPDKQALIEFVRTHHPREIKKLEQERRIFEWQQIQSLAWLDADIGEFAPKIAAFTKPLGYLKQYEQHGYPIFQSELGVVLSHALLKLPTEGIKGAFGKYIEERRRANGSFNNTLTTDGGDGHVMNTLWGLQASQVLGLEIANKAELIAWLQSCQAPSGAFLCSPKPEFGGVDDIVYTRAAVRALKLLGADLSGAKRDACIAQIHSLAMADGGFSDRVGWLSNGTATYYALDALDTLGALDTLATVKRKPLRKRTTLPSNLKIFTIQIESHGVGSPADAVELARTLQIDMWGTKNARPGWTERAQAIAIKEKVPVKFFLANEEYGTWVNFPGLGTYSHTSDLIAPGDTDIGPPLGRRGEVSPPVAWEDFRNRRLVSLERGRGRLVWQFGENEELVRMLLDDSAERGGFAMISTFHFGNPDFMNTEPFLNRWRGKIPFIALQDAHGNDPWWFGDQTSGFRTLFLGTEPTWDAWLNALKQNWTASARRDVWTKGKTWMHTGSDEVLDLLRSREAEWRWWDNPKRYRPMVSLQALTPADEMEPGKPEKGIALRVRAAWENTPQGLLKTPLSEFVRLTVDGRETKPELVDTKAQNNMHSEYHHKLTLTDLAPGKHTATATVKVLATGKEAQRTIEFTVG